MDKREFGGNRIGSERLGIKWQALDGPQKQNLIGRFFKIDDSNKHQFITQIMKLKYSKFEDLPADFIKFISDKL